MTLGSYQMMLVVNEDVPAKTFSEFVEYARGHRPPLNYGSVGIGSAHHLSMEVLKSLANIDLVHVPYRGGGPATLAHLAREIPVMFNGPVTIKEHVELGRLRVLATTGKSRSPLFPDAPTIAESGYPTFNIVNWYVAGARRDAAGHRRESSDRCCQSDGSAGIPRMDDEARHRTDVRRPSRI